MSCQAFATDRGSYYHFANLGKTVRERKAIEDTLIRDEIEKLMMLLKYPGTLNLKICQLPQRNPKTGIGLNTQLTVRKSHGIYEFGNYEPGDFLAECILFWTDTSEGDIKNIYFETDGHVLIDNAKKISQFQRNWIQIRNLNNRNAKIEFMRNSAGNSTSQVGLGIGVAAILMLALRKLHVSDALGRLFRWMQLRKNMIIKKSQKKFQHMQKVERGIIHRNQRDLAAFRRITSKKRNQTSP